MNIPFQLKFSLDRNIPFQEWCSEALNFFFWPVRVRQKSSFTDFIL
jgi:hypothetical protein